ncbi:Rossmann-like and DUF2520 domain-containing protein [Seonamhaeicola aphaedonensis]|uniref:Coenzyme F420-dependent NADP oxidoreductase-like protein n=1 Tax=Seonamhaeicola aphaedonensis TaxID=1461338 RepID=A0A3D9HFF2_9FLAO|nr:DUF2520 domain-containing protein [Seonamhaeicola aphaedonensis]RED48222.1 coenzyme F420-dependent NADP oxidoreductase-like protein [Seonamhaeicola aphaedonensis]
MISVIILGAGNVATHLYKAFKKAENISVKQWYNRNIKSLNGYKNKVDVTDDFSKLKDADIYIIAVSDDAVSNVSSKIPFENKLVVHTSGSVNVHDLDKKHKRGVLYPLQTFSKSTNLNFLDIPICIETIDKKDYHTLKSLATSISNTVKKVNSNQRQVLHLAAVYVNNFTNQLYRIGHEITESEGAEFDLLKPLIQETARKVQELSPYMAQTGPAKRNDKKTIKKHLKLLKSEHHLNIYNLLTESIQKTHGR